jgi:flagellar hook-length control protein FliK
LHRCRWRIPSTEVELSTHLTIAYTAPGTASGTPAVAGGTAAAAGEAQGNNPFGFLAALVDQLLAGSAAQAANTPTSGAADTKATPPTPAGTPSVPNLLDVSLGAQTGKTAGTPGANVLLAKLVAELKTLEQQMANGSEPDPALLQKLGETADALAALIAKPSGSSAAPASTAVSLDPLTTIKSATAGKDDKPEPAVLDTGTAPASTLSDQLAQLLASIGIQVPAATTTAPAAVLTTDTTAVSSASAATAPPLPAIAQLATQLSELGQAVAGSAPDVAQKLAALSHKLDGAEADPTVLAQLTTPDDTGATTLDKIVQSLLAAKPAAAVTTPATPQIAASAQLQAPPTVTTGTQAATLDPSPQPVVAAPSTATSRSAPKATDAAKPVDSSHDDTTKTEAKIIAAATTQADSKSDPADAKGAQPNASAVGAPATPATPRVLPAAYQAAGTPINMAQVAFEMVRQMHQGQSRFSIRIDPPELGRVDVKMHVDASGNVNARLTVERSETLDMFQRDRGSLEKALTQAGLDGAKTNLEFSLRQNPFAGMMGGDQRPGNGNPSGPRFSLTAEADDAITPSTIPSVTLYRGIASSGGVNLFV